MGRWDVVKKNTGPPQTGVPGGNLVCFNPRGIRRSKAVWEGQNRQGWRKEGGPGGGGLFGNWAKGLPSPCWDPPAPPVWQEGGSLQPPQAGLGLPDAPRRGLEGAHKGLPSREMTALPPSFSARVQRSLTSS